MRRFFCWLLGHRVDRRVWEDARPHEDAFCCYCLKTIEHYPVRFK